MSKSETIAVRVAAKQKRRLEAIQKRIGAESLSVVAQRAFAVFEFLTEQEEQGQTTLLESPDGSLARVVLTPGLVDPFTPHLTVHD